VDEGQQKYTNLLYQLLSKPNEEFLCSHHKLGFEMNEIFVNRAKIVKV